VRVWAEVDGVPLLDRAFQRVERVAERPMREAEREIDEWFEETEGEQFASGGAAGASGKWAELAPSTVERKGFLGYFPLVDTNALKLSLTRKGAKYSIRFVTDTEYARGTDRPGAVHHQRGTRRMPARRVIDPSERQKRRLVKRIQKAVLVPLRRTGLVESEFTERVG
jgi:hypothetical protein